jgi:hypothetical protein
MTGGRRSTAVRAAANRQPGLSRFPTLQFAGDKPAMLGLLHMLQALQHAVHRYAGTFAAKIAPNSNPPLRPIYWLNSPNYRPRKASARH